MIAFIDGSISNKSKKWLDIEITNTFPVIALPSKIKIVLPSGEVIETFNEYDHISIPADLRIHLSGKNSKIFFDAILAWSLQKNKINGPLKLFTFFGLPIAQSPYLSGGKNRRWDGAVLVSPKTDNCFNSSQTRMVIEFFIHKEFNENEIVNFPFVDKNIRLAYDNSACLLGPFVFEGIQRKHSTDSDLLFTIRYGFAELEPNDTAFFFPSQEIYKKIKI